MDTIIPTQISNYEANAFANQYSISTDDIYKTSNIDTFEASFEINKMYMLMAQDNTFHYITVRSISPVFAIGICATGEIESESYGYKFKIHEMKQKAFMTILQFKVIYIKYFEYCESLLTVRSNNDITATQYPPHNVIHMHPPPDNRNFIPNTLNAVGERGLHGNVRNLSPIPVPPTAIQPLRQQRRVADEEIKDDENYVENVTCNICLTNKIAVCYMPCGHTACGTCSNRITLC
mgnify:CR=1 FL=1